MKKKNLMTEQEWLFAESNVFRREALPVKFTLSKECIARSNVLRREVLRVKFNIGDVVVLEEVDPQIYSIGEIFKIYETCGMDGQVSTRTYKMYLLYSNHYLDLKPYDCTYGTSASRLRKATLGEIVNLRQAKNQT